jgi:LPS sulfotransferase NodH
MKIGILANKLLENVRQPVPDVAAGPVLRGFDWDAHGVTNPYVIFMTGRCGSTWLTTVLKNTGLAGHPLEYFNGDIAQREVRGAVGLEQYFASVVERDTREGRFGLEIDAVRMQQVEPLLDWNGVFPPDRVATFFLHRRDILAQAWSWVAAAKTGIWHLRANKNFVQVPKDTTPPTHAELAAEIVRIRKGEEYLEAFFDRSGYAPFYLDYELLMTELATEVATILRLLGWDEERIAAAPIAEQGATSKLSYSERHAVLADFNHRYRDVMAQVRRDRFGVGSAELMKAFA